MTSPTGKTWVVVADAARARIFEQSHPGATLASAVGADLVGSRAAGRDHAADRPGRGHERHGPGRHAKQPRTDPRDVEQTKLVRELAHLLEQTVHGGDVDRFVFVASPAFLGELRSSVSGAVRGKVAAELDKDLSHLPVHELEKQLAPVLGRG